MQEREQERVKKVIPARAVYRRQARQVAKEAAEIYNAERLRGEPLRKVLEKTELLYDEMTL